MMQSQRIGGRYLAALTMVFAAAHFVIGTLGPVRQSPFYLLLVPLPALAALALGWRAWRKPGGKSASYSEAALATLLLALFLWRLQSGRF